jgi:hypothetical protein
MAGSSRWAGSTSIMLIGPAGRTGQGAASRGTRRGEAAAEDAGEQAQYALVEAPRANDARIFQGGFRALVHSATEVKRIGARYHSARPDEPVVAWQLTARMRRFTNGEAANYENRNWSAIELSG